MPPLASLGFAVSLGVIAVGQTELSFWFGVSFAGIFGGLIAPATSTALIELTPPQALPAAMGIQRTAADLGFVAGPMVIGLLSDSLFGSETFGMLINSLLLIISGAAWLWAIRRRAGIESETAW